MSLAVRPAWWTPEGVLERLEAGERPMALCRKVEYETNVSFRSIYNDLTRWRKTEEGFDERYREAVNWGRGAGGQPNLPPAWEALWLKAWELTGQPVRACDMVEEETGYRPKYKTIRNKIDPNHHSFDETFAKRYHEIEEEVLGRRVDDLFGAFEDPTLMARDRIRGNLDLLERRHQDWKRHTKIEHEGTVTHQHGPSPGLMERFHSMIEGRFERAGMPRQEVKELPEAKVVEIDLPKQRELAEVEG